MYLIACFTALKLICVCHVFVTLLGMPPPLPVTLPPAHLLNPGMRHMHSSTTTSTITSTKQYTNNRTTSQIVSTRIVDPYHQGVFWFLHRFCLIGF